MNPEQKVHSYDIIIPIWKPGKEFDRVLKMLKKQEPAPSRIILLETMEDGDPYVPYPGCEIVEVKKSEFDHAGTRRLGVSYSRAEAFIFMTQDAIPMDTKLCAKLLEGLYAWENKPEDTQKNGEAEKDPEPVQMEFSRNDDDDADLKPSVSIVSPETGEPENRKETEINRDGQVINSARDMEPDTSSWDNVPQNEYVRLIREHENNFRNSSVQPDGRIAVCYARQVAAENSPEREKFVRRFNYPEESLTKSIEDLPKMGIKTFFASNVCCAYNRDVYESLMGFNFNAIFNEDMLYAAKAMKQGFSVAYAADAVVIHSHNYTAMQQFHRMFDNGMSQAMHPAVFSGIVSEGEGKRMVKEGAAHLMKTGHPLQVLGLLWQSGFKYLGFRMGKQYRKYTYKKLRRLALNKTYIDRHFGN